MPKDLWLLPETGTSPFSGIFDKPSLSHIPYRHWACAANTTKGRPRVFFLLVEIRAQGFEPIQTKREAPQLKLQGSCPNLSQPVPPSHHWLTLKPQTQDHTSPKQIHPPTKSPEPKQKKTTTQGSKHSRHTPAPGKSENLG